MEDLLLHRKDVEMPQCLEVPSVIAWRVGELRVNGDEKSSDGHIFTVEGVVAVAEEDKAD